MQFYKRTIYNRKLNSVANEISTIASSSQDVGENADYQQLFTDFISILLSETSSSDSKNFKVIIPFQFTPYLEDVPEEVLKHIVLKVPLRGNDASALETINRLHNNLHSVAIEIKDEAAIPSLPDFAFLYLVDISLLDVIENISGRLNLKKLVVNNVDEHHELSSLINQDINYFSGDFILKPKRLKKANIATNKLSVMQLITKLNDPDVELDEVTKVITADNLLSFKLLKVVNSPLFRGINELNSVQDAIIRFGYMNLKKWGLMLSLCSIQDKPNALTQLTIERAIMCQNLAEAKHYVDVEAFYTVGLFSTLDAFLDAPIEQLLDEVSLTEEIKTAILTHEGLKGEVLKSVIHYQKGLPLDEDEIALTQIFIESAQEAKETLNIVGL